MSSTLVAETPVCVSAETGEEQATAQELCGEPLRATARGCSSAQEAFERARDGLVVTDRSNPLINYDAQNNRGIIFDADGFSALRREIEGSKDAQTLPLKVLLSQGASPSSAGALEAQQRLVKLHQTAWLYQSERGAPCLYLALGALAWKEQGSGRQNLSPLLLVPVVLVREHAGAPFSMRVGAEDIQDNLALRKRFKDEFAIDLPAWRGMESAGLGGYLKEISRTLAGQRQTQAAVIPDMMALDIFAFASHLLHADLDPKIWPEGEKPWEHPIVRGLLGGDFGAAQNPGTAANAEGERLDVLNTDASQAALLDAVRAGELRVTVGPPGTGKSTTIVNAIANAVADGKRVLFISEKEDAINVVRRWLESAGLGDLCLHVKAGSTRKSVVDDLRKTLELGEPHTAARELNTDQRAGFEAKLNAHPQLMAQEAGTSGFTAYEALSALVALGVKRGNRCDLKDPCLNLWNKDTYVAARAFARDLQAAQAKLGVPEKHPFFGVGLAHVEELDNAKLAQAILSAHSATHKYNAALSALFRKLNLAADMPETEIESALAALQAINELYTDNGKFYTSCALRNEKSHAQDAEILRMAQDELRYAQLREKSQGSINFDILAKVDLTAIAKAIDQHETSGFFGRLTDGNYRQALKTLRSITQAGATLAEQRDTVKLLQQIQSLAVESPARAAIWQDLNLPCRLGSEDAKEALKAARIIYQFVPALIHFGAAAEKSSQASALRTQMQYPSSVYRLSTDIREIIDLREEHLRQRDAVLSELQFSAEDRAKRIAAKPLSAQEELLGVWRNSLDKLEPYLQYHDLVRRGREAGFGFIADRAASWRMGESLLVEALDHAWFSCLVSQFTGMHPDAASFDAREHESLIEQFVKADDDTLSANAAAIAHKHWDELPRYGLGGASAILHHEVKKRSGHIPVRELLATAGKAVQKVKPVFMMSPHAVARHLMPGAIDFDLVIFDEGSQLKPLHAIGAIARGKQLMPVGDPMQLPPTPFFERESDLHTQALGELAERPAQKLESVLDLLSRADVPTHNLSWHYRSRRPGLVAVSNEEFYGGKLKVLPGVERGAAAHGITYHQVPGGTYEAGRRVNEVEARAVVAAILDHARARPNESLGVVSLNRPQAELIASILERERQRHPELESFFDDGAGISQDGKRKREQFFIKNLENVQGDERDHMIISLGFGPNAEGKLNLNFGAINAAGGERRLNVLISRARNWCDVFSSLDPEASELSQSTNRGVQVLQRYLLHARDGAAAAQQEESSRVASPFQLVVRQALEKLGYDVRTNVGPKGGVIDIAVINPSDPSRYLLAVQLDGKQYQSIESARDRDKILPLVYRERGLPLHRVWALGWLNDEGQEIERLEESLQNALNLYERMLNGSAEETVSGRAVRSIERDAAKTPEPLSIPYKEAKLPARLLGSLLVDLKRAAIDYAPHFDTALWAEAFRSVVQKEGPVRREEARNRIAKAMAGWRVPDILDAALEAGEQEALNSRMISSRWDFLYESPEQKIIPRDRSALRTGMRSVVYIAPEELDAALYNVAKNSCGVSREDLCESAAALLGLKSSTYAVDNALDTRIAELMREGVLIEEEGMIETSGDKGQ